MMLLLGHLPTTSENDIRELLSKFSTVSEVQFLGDKNDTKPRHPSDYECIVKMDISNPAVGNIIANKINHLCWRGSSINAHMLVF